MVFTFHPPPLTESEIRLAGSSMLSEQDPMTLSELQEYEEDRSMLESGDATATPSSCSYSSSASRTDSSERVILLSEFMQDYDVIAKLGEGSFGVVYKIQHKDTREIYARKDVDWSKFTDLQVQHLTQEVDTLWKLNHFNIVRYIDAFIDNTTKYAHIIMEYCGGGTLDDVIKSAAEATRKRSPESHKYLLTEARIWRYFAQLVAALEHCHHPNARNNPDEERKRGPLIHRDLKAANVFLDDKDYIKVGDFGLSKMIEFGELAGTICGSPMYMAPEIMSKKKYNASVDIWGLGCIVYELCELEPAFTSHSRSGLQENIVHGHMRPMVSPYSDTLKNLVKSMLQLNPTSRPTAEQLMKPERIYRTMEILGFETNSDNSPIFLEEYTKVLREETAACTDDERRLRHFHSEAMSQKAELVHKMQQHIVTMVSPEAANLALKNALQQAEARLQEELKRCKDTLEREYQGKEQAFFKQQRKRTAEFEAAVANKRRCLPAAQDFDRRSSQLERQKLELDEREAEANQRDFDFYLQKLVRAAKGHARYADFIHAMYYLVEAAEQTRKTNGRYKLDSRDLAVIHRAVLHSKATEPLKMYHHEAKAAWFCLLPKHLHVVLEGPQIWDEENFPGMGDISSTEVECPRFPEEARSK